ncbi:MAG: RidA family protein [Longimicrobiales bacterium]
MSASPRQRIDTAASWARTVGYSRALRVGDRIEVAGTAAVGVDGAIAHPDDVYGQAKRCLEIIIDALQQLGGGAEHVVRTRVYLTDAAHWQAVGRAHGEVFGATRPVTSFVVVAGLIDPAMLVEIEAEAVL